MAENIVRNTNTRLTVLEKGLNAILDKLGINTSVPEGDETESAPKTSARLRGSRDRAEFAKKAKKSGHDPVVIVLTEAMIEGRMKLPARMFTKGNKVLIDGHTFTQQPQDQNRSTKFNPEIFGYEVEVGDVMTFTHVQGREWEVEVEEGEAPAPKRNAKKAGRSSAGKSQSSAKPKPQGLKRDAKGQDTVKSLIAEFAEKAIANGNDDDFEENENIKKTGAFETDARIYLTTQENQQFRSRRKKLGLSLKKAVSLLNAAVFEDED